MTDLINPLNPHDASMHPFASLKNDLMTLLHRGFRTAIFMKLIQ